MDIETPIYKCIGVTRERINSSANGNGKKRGAPDFNQRVQNLAEELVLKELDARVKAELEKALEDFPIDKWKDEITSPLKVYDFHAKAAATIDAARAKNKKAQAEKSLVYFDVDADKGRYTLKPLSSEDKAKLDEVGFFKLGGITEEEGIWACKDLKIAKGLDKVAKKALGGSSERALPPKDELKDEPKGEPKLDPEAQAAPAPEVAEVAVDNSKKAPARTWNYINWNGHVYFIANCDKDLSPIADELKKLTCYYPSHPPHRWEFQKRSKGKGINELVKAFVEAGSSERALPAELELVEDSEEYFVFKGWSGMRCYKTVRQRPMTTEDYRQILSHVLAGKTDTVIDGFPGKNGTTYSLECKLGENAKGYPKIQFDSIKKG